MGMRCSLLGLTRAQMTTLKDSPSLVANLTDVVQSDAFDREFAEEMNHLPPDKRELAEANKRKSDQRPEMEALNAQTEEHRKRLHALMPFQPALDLDKSWHILHYLMTGHSGFEATNEPGDGLLGGDEIGPDLGYGPARLLDVTGTRRFADFLRTQNVAALDSRIRYAEMMRLQIYGMPGGAGDVTEFESQIRELVVNYFPLLNDYVLAMAAKGDGLLIWIT